MENRAVLAAVLMAALLILYQVLFVSSPAPPPPASAPEGVAKPVPTPEKTAPPPAVLPPARPLPRFAERTVAVDTPLYHAIVGSEGGRLLGWTLHYRGEKVLAERGQMGLSGLILERPGVGGAPVEFTITGGPVTLDGKVGEDRVEVGLRGAVTLGPGQVWEARAQLYAGPKEYRQLRAHGLEGAINFGGFPLPRRYGGLPMEWLGVPVLLVMNFFYRFI